MHWFVYLAVAITQCVDLWRSNALQRALPQVMKVRSKEIAVLSIFQVGSLFTTPFYQRDIHVALKMAAEETKKVRIFVVGDPGEICTLNKPCIINRLVYVSVIIWHLTITEFGGGCCRGRFTNDFA